MIMQTMPAGRQTQQIHLMLFPAAAAVLDAKTLPDIFAGKRGPEKKEGALQQQRSSIMQADAIQSCNASNMTCSS